MDIFAERLAKLSPEQRALFELRLQQSARRSLSSAPILRRQNDSYLPLSISQERLWFLHQMNPETPVYNIPSVVHLKGNLDEQVLAHGFNMIVQRHEALRTNFAVKDGQPVQVIKPSHTVIISVTDLAYGPTDERQDRMYTLAREFIRQPFDVARDPLLRSHLFRIAQDEHVLVIVLHHLVADGWSMRVLMRELMVLYEALLAGRPSPLIPLPIQYVDFALWQRQWLQEHAIAGQLIYWNKQLKNVPTALKLPTDRPRPPLQTFRGAQHHFAIAQSDLQAVLKLGQQTGTTPFMILLATLKMLLYHYTGQADIAVGSGIANRNRVETENLIGFVVNTLVLRTQLSEWLTFRELLERVRATTLGAYANPDVPFEKLLEGLQVQRNPSYSPLLQVTFTFQNIPVPTVNLPDLTLQHLQVDSATSKFDLELYLENLPEGFVGFLEYNTDLFNESTIIQMVERYQLLLSNSLAQPDQRLDALLSVIDQTQRRQRMEQKKLLKQSGIEKFKNTKRKVISYSQETVVQKNYLQENNTLPLVIQPQIDNVSLIEWITHHREEIGHTLREHGGILFRDFHIGSISEFEQLSRALHPDLLNYKERSTQRSEVGGKVYTSTDYPADQSIPLHNELSYSHEWPMKIAFFSVQVAQQGGETPIADSRKVYQLIPPNIIERFIQKKVMYVRNYGNGVDLPWQTVFQTTNKADVEDYCRAVGIEFEWRDGDQLRTHQVRQSVASHPITGETVWFNQAHLFHISSLKAELRDALVSTFREEDLPRNAYYGDGTPFEPEVLEAIRHAYHQATVSFPWQEGDILLLDNMLVAHGRAPFTGTRKVVVTMAEPFNSQAVK